MATSYLYTALTAQVVDSTSFPTASSDLTIRNAVNRAARIVASEVDLRSLKRRAALATKAFDDAYTYTCPTDLKSTAIIDIIPQGESRQDERDYRLVDQRYFDRQKVTYNNLVAVADDDMTRTLLLSVDVPNDESTTISELGTTSDGGGTWAVFGNASTLAADDSNYISGGSSLSFSLTSGGTTAGIQNSTLNTFDVTGVKADGYIFAWVYITATANISNVIIRVGSDSSNYYELTETAQFDGTAFVAGWNLIGADFASKTTTGTPDDDACDYAVIHFTKTSGKTGDGYRFDKLWFAPGWYYEVVYYSKYAWQNTSGTWIENSTADTDYINADTDEIDGFVFKAREEIYKDLREFDLMEIEAENYKNWKKTYTKRNPSQKIKKQEKYW